MESVGLESRITDILFYLMQESKAPLTPSLALPGLVCYNYLVITVSWDREMARS